MSAPQRRSLRLTVPSSSPAASCILTAAITLSTDARLSAQVQRDQLGDAGRTLAAFDLDDQAIVDLQAVGRHVLGFRDCDESPQTRAGGHWREIADTVGAIVERILQSLEADDRADEHGCEAEG